LYIEGNDWCDEHQRLDLYERFRVEFLSDGEDNEIEQITVAGDCSLEPGNFGYYQGGGEPFVATAPDRIQALMGAEDVLVDNNEHVRGVLYNGQAYRTYAQSICLLGMNNEYDFDRAEFFGNILDKLAGYQGHLTGVIINDNTNEPVQNATISVAGCNKSLTTDVDGRFEFTSLPRENFRLDVDCQGYFSIYRQLFSFDGEKELELTIRLQCPNLVIERDAQPTTFELISVYPNPFNSRTTVSFFLPEVFPLQLSISDQNGRLISEIGYSSISPGFQQLEIDASDWSSGTYLLNLSTPLHHNSEIITFVK
jgi:hypothetical protein